jgi:hypothetical protein
MKFIIVKEICHTHEDRVCILKRYEDYFKRGQETTKVYYLCNAVIQVTKDWNTDTKFSIVDDTASIQYRPKGIFSNKKGFYYKNKGVIYLTKDEVDEMFQYMSEALEYINSAQKTVEKL